MAERSKELTNELLTARAYHQEEVIKTLRLEFELLELKFKELILETQKALLEARTR